MCLSSSKVWVRQLRRWLSNGCKAFRRAKGEEVLLWRKSTFFFCPLPHFLMSDANCTPAVNITLQLSFGTGSLEVSGLVETTALLAPPMGSFWLGFQLRVPEKAGGGAGVNHWAGSLWVKVEEGVVTQLSRVGWGATGAQEREKPTQTHRLLGEVGALTLCSRYSPSQSLQEINT